MPGFDRIGFKDDAASGCGLCEDDEAGLDMGARGLGALVADEP